jgi:hypothetical protein
MAIPTGRPFYCPNFCGVYVRLLLTRQTVGSITALMLDHADHTFDSTVEGVTVEAVSEPTTMVLLFTDFSRRGSPFQGPFPARSLVDDTRQFLNLIGRLGHFALVKCPTFI